MPFPCWISRSVFPSLGTRKKPTPDTAICIGVTTTVSCRFGPVHQLEASKCASRVVFVVSILLGTLGGCSGTKPDTSQFKYAEKLKAGMTLADVEAAIGSGEVISYEKLPESFRIAVTKGGPSGEYRRWIKKDGGTTTTIFIEFKDGKAGDPLFEWDAK